MLFRILFVLISLSSAQKLLELNVGDELPQFSQKTVNQMGRVSTTLWTDSAYTVVVDFAASWCVPCRLSIPKLMNCVQSNPNSRMVVVMSDKEWGERQEKFMADLGLNAAKISVVWDQYGVLARRFKLGSSLPVTVITQDGKIASVHEGLVEKSECSAVGL